MSTGRKPRHPLRYGRWGLVLLCVTAVLAAMGAWLLGRGKATNAGRTTLTTSRGQLESAQQTDKQIYKAYAGSASCRNCHEQEFDQWAGSHHALAQRLPDPRIDSAAFNPSRTLRRADHTTTVRQSGTEFEIETVGF